MAAAAEDLESVVALSRSLKAASRIAGVVFWSRRDIGGRMDKGNIAGKRRG